MKKSSRSRFFLFVLLIVMKWSPEMEIRLFRHCMVQFRDLKMKPTL